MDGKVDGLAVGSNEGPGDRSPEGREEGFVKGLAGRYKHELKSIRAPAVSAIRGKQWQADNKCIPHTNGFVWQKIDRNVITPIQSRSIVVCQLVGTECGILLTACRNWMWHTFDNNDGKVRSTNNTSVGLYNMRSNTINKDTVGRV
jgi:hypothetical protein